MAMKGNTSCAVPECALPISGFNNLCNEHRLPGMMIHVGESTMVIAAWYAEHRDEAGIILLNDWALGNYFSGRAGFEAQLADQGFVNVRNLSTPEEVHRAKRPPNGKNPGAWSGPWLPQYPWELTESNPRTEANISSSNKSKPSRTLE
jgi:hypothetical protein